MTLYVLTSFINLALNLLFKIINHFINVLILRPICAIFRNQNSIFAYIRNQSVGLESVSKSNPSFGC